MGAIHHYQLQLPKSYSAYERSFQHFKRQQQETGVSERDDVEFELELSFRLSGMAGELGRLDAAQAWLNHGHQLRSDFPIQNDGVWGVFLLTQALIFQWRNNPYQALQWGAQALTIWQPSDARTSLAFGRASAVLGQIALDVGDEMRLRVDPTAPAPLHSQAYTDCLTAAAPYIADAHAHLPREHDAIGYGLAELAHGRWLLATGRPLAAAAAIEPIIRLAGRFNDGALLGQAWAGLGSAMAVYGAQESALLLYHRAWHILREHDLLAASQRPQRALDALRQAQP